MSKTCIKFPIHSLSLDQISSNSCLAENFLFFVPSGPNIKKEKKKKKKKKKRKENRNEFSLDSYIIKQKMDPKLVGDIPKITILRFSACLNR